MSTPGTNITTVTYRLISVLHNLHEAERSLNRYAADAEAGSTEVSTFFRKLATVISDHAEECYELLLSQAPARDFGAGQSVRQQIAPRP